MENADERRKRLYDNACKKVLSEKGIIGHILKTCVKEYENVPIDDIVNKYIQGTPEVEKLLVQPDDNIFRIESTHTEDFSEEDESVFFDVRFTALAPGTEELIELIINIEAQNNFYPGYPLLKRGIYYCSRMISSQYGTVFIKSHYEKIKKVYSIWVCTHSSKEWEYNIARYGIMEESLVGNMKAKPAHYDLLSVVMICLGKKQYTELEGLLRLLNIIFVDNNLTKRQKIRKLSNEFSIKMTPSLERGVKKMCNLSEGVERRGIEKGMARGLKQGMARGLEQGIARGLTEGREQMATDMALDMLRDNKPMEEVIKYTRLPLERIQELAEQVIK